MTKKKTRYKSARLNLFMILLCLSLSAVSVWLFYKDLNSSSSRTDKDQVATITFKYKIAQRKYNDRVIWERLNQDSPLYNGDTIHTADMAEATINCNNGVGIEVFENSMLQIFVDKDGNIKVSVSGGNIDVDTSNARGDVFVDVGNYTVASMKKDGRMSAALNDNVASFRVLEGNAVIVDADGNQTATVTAGESVRVSSSGKVSRIPITVTSVGENQKVLVFEDSSKGTVIPNSVSESLLLEWTPLADKSQKVIVETSTKNDFSAIKDTFTVTEKNSVELPSSEGVLFWRVYLENDTENAANGKLNFEEIPPVQPTYPNDKDVFSSYYEEPVINLSWSGNDYAKKYKVEVSKNADFSPAQIVRETNSQNISLNDLGDGEYFWRVTPYYELNNVGYYGTSNEKSFSITKNEIVQKDGTSDLPAPNLVEPKENQKIGVAYLEKNRSITFTWDEVPDATDYDFVLFQKTDGGLKEIYSEKNIADTKVKIDDLKMLDIASFQWQVAAKNKAKNGFVIQNGTAAVQVFDIDFELPGKIRQFNPGVVYGE